MADVLIRCVRIHVKFALVRGRELLLNLKAKDKAEK